MALSHQLRCINRPHKVKHTICQRLDVSMFDVSMLARLVCRFLNVVCAVLGLSCVKDVVSVMWGLQSVLCAGLRLCYVRD